MFIEIEENTFLNSNQVVGAELITLESEPYGETYQWVFYTTSPSERSIFHGRIFDSKEEAIKWFQNVKDIINKYKG